MTSHLRRYRIVLLFAWLTLAVAVARYGSCVRRADPLGAAAKTSEGRTLSELADATCLAACVALGVTTIVVALVRWRAAGARTWIWSGRLLALCWLTVLPVAQYAGISNAGELYSYPGDDTGVWQYGSLLPWSELPAPRVVFPYLAILREPFVEFSIRALPLMVPPNDTDARRWAQRNFTGRPRRWDVIGTAVNTTVWLLVAAAVCIGVRHEARRKGAVPLDVAGVVLSMMSIVLLLGTLHLILLGVAPIAQSAWHSFPRAWSAIRFYLRPSGS